MSKDRNHFARATAVSFIHLINYTIVWPIILATFFLYNIARVGLINLIGLIVLSPYHLSEILKQKIRHGVYCGPSFDERLYNYQKRAQKPPSLIFLIALGLAAPVVFILLVAALISIVPATLAWLSYGFWKRLPQSIPVIEIIMSYGIGKYFFNVKYTALFNAVDTNPINNRSLKRRLERCSVEERIKYYSNNPSPDVFALAEKNPDSSLLNIFLSYPEYLLTLSKNKSSQLGVKPKEHPPNVEFFQSVFRLYNEISKIEKQELRKSLTDCCEAVNSVPVIEKPAKKNELKLNKLIQTLIDRIQNNATDPLIEKAINQIIEHQMDLLKYKLRVHVWLDSEGYLNDQFKEITFDPTPFYIAAAVLSANGHADAAKNYLGKQHGYALYNYRVLNSSDFANTLNRKVIPTVTKNFITKDRSASKVKKPTIRHTQDDLCLNKKNNAAQVGSQDTNGFRPLLQLKVKESKVIKQIPQNKLDIPPLKKPSKSDVIDFKTRLK